MLCIEATMNAQTVEATASAVVTEWSAEAADGISATMQAYCVTATMGQAVGFDATATAMPVDAYISYSCPIAYIESCFSLGGWYNDLGWDNNLGWKN